MKTKTKAIRYNGNSTSVTRKPVRRPPKLKSFSTTMKPSEKFRQLDSNRISYSNFFTNSTNDREPLRTNSTMSPLVINGLSTNKSLSLSDNKYPELDFDDDNNLVSNPYTTTGMILTTIPVGIIIFIIFAGNALVIAAVLKDSRLKRQVQNWLIVSVAAADMFVGMLIMPLTLIYELLDEWVFGDILCELWLALDVLFVTASILNLCAISLDRYWSLTDPTSYPQKRTPKRMLLMIIIVWLSAFAISFPPLVGWRSETRKPKVCFISDHLGYVLYSSLGSFFVPVFVLLFVYARIYCITRKRSKSRPINNMQLKGTNNTNATTPLKTPIIRCEPLRKNGFTKTNKNSNSDSSNEHTEATSTTMRSNCNNNGSASARASVQVAPAEIQMFAENDYAVLVAKVRSLALMGRNNSIVSEQLTIDSSMSSPENPRSRLSIVASIANEAVQQSRMMRQQNKQQQHQPQQQDTLAATANFELKKQLQQRQKLVRRRERQATLVLGLVLGAFIGSWLPFFSVYLLSATGYNTSDLVFDLVFWLGYCNSGFNPFIYNFFNPDFRRAFKKILKAPVDKLRQALIGSQTLISADRRRSSTASALGGTPSGRKHSSLLPPVRHKKRRGAVFSPRHPYLQVQQQQRQALIVSPYDNLDE